jgi:hypothetical protein
MNATQPLPELTPQSNKPEPSYPARKSQQKPTALADDDGESTAPRMLKPERVAERLGVDVTTLSRWRNRGFGPRFAKYGKGMTAVIRYSEADVAAFIAESMRQSTSDQGEQGG